MSRNSNHQVAQMTTFAAVLRWACLALCGLFLLACRLDMHVQPKYKPLDSSSFFGDGRSVRPEDPGTVAHGHLRTDELRSRSRRRSSSGAVSASISTARPVTTTRAAGGDWLSREVSRPRLRITLTDWLKRRRGISLTLSPTGTAQCIATRRASIPKTVGLSSPTFERFS